MPLPSVAVAETHTAGPGKKLLATYTQKPPTLTPEQAKQLQEEWAEADREGPRQPNHLARNAAQKDDRPIRRHREISISFVTA